MADQDPRSFKKYKVTGPVEIRDDRTEGLVPPGGVVELTEEDWHRTVRGPDGPMPFVQGGTKVNALLYSGFIDEIPEDAPAPAAAKAPKA